MLNPFSAARNIRSWLRRRREAARLVNADAEGADTRTMAAPPTWKLAGASAT
jgi:hypothetical protein